MNTAWKICSTLLATSTIFNFTADRLSEKAANDILNGKKTELQATGIDTTGYNRLMSNLENKSAMTKGIEIQKAIDSMKSISPSRVEFEATQLIKKGSKIIK